MSDAERLEQLYGLELQLLQPATRSSRRNLEDLLADDFVEIGSMGTLYDRARIWKLSDGRWRMTFHQGTRVQG